MTASEPEPDPGEPIPYWPRYYTPLAAAAVSQAEREAAAEADIEP